MKISQLEQILEVAEAGSISQAAANLYMGQPNISLTIKNVEQEMGVTLFERTSTGVNLTHAGRDFVERAKEIMLQLDALENTSSIGNKQKEILELYVASLTHKDVCREVAKLLEKYKDRNIKVDLINALGTKLLDTINENRAEIGFCTVYEFSKKIMMRQIAMRRLEYHYIGSATSGIYVGNNNKRFSNEDKFVIFEKLKDMPFVELAKREFNAQTIADYLYTEKGISIDFNKLIRVSSFGELRNMVELTDSFAIASLFDIPYENGKCYDELRFIPFKSNFLKAEFGYVKRQNTKLSPLAEELLEGIESKFKK